jgi:hypothetical protein
MKILCCCIKASILTGSELYFYELCDGLAILGHDVTLASTEISQFFIDKCSKFKLAHISEIKQNSFDLIVLSHYLETFHHIENIIGDTPIINIVHSEIYPNEIPLIHDNVLKYVGVRESICDKIESFGVNRKRIQMVRNPIDLNKFNTNDISDENFGLFVGTMGGVRFKSALHFSRYCKYNNLKSVYISAENVSVPFFDICLPSCNDVEKYFKSCTVSGGVMRGRTYFEARLCGKPTIEYFINNMGEITNIDYEDTPDEIEVVQLQLQFHKINVAKNIIEA